MPVLYLVDERVSNARAVLDSVPAVDLGFPIHAYMAVSEIVLTVVKKLSGAASGGRSDPLTAPMITAVRILAHGNREELALGRGIDARNATQLAPLSSHIRGGASGDCRLLGCNMGSGAPAAARFFGGVGQIQGVGAPGSASSVSDSETSVRVSYPLLHALARALILPVTAGLEAPSPAYDWQILGATITVDPFGRETIAEMNTLPVLAPPSVRVDFWA